MIDTLISLFRFRFQKEAATKNPLFKRVSKDIFGCEFNQCPDNLTLGANETFAGPEIETDIVLDGVDALYYGIQDFLKDCGTLDPRKCLENFNLIRHVSNVEFSRRGKTFKFDELGEKSSCVAIDQLFINDQGVAELHMVFEYDIEKRELIEYNDLMWPEVFLDGKDIVESVCSSPCDLRSARQQTKNACCYKCVECGLRAIVNNYKCVTCPKFTVPDKKSNFTNCVELEVIYLSITNIYGIILVIVLGVSTCTYIFVCSVLWTYRYARAMSRRRLSFVVILSSIG